MPRRFRNSDTRLSKTSTLPQPVTWTAFHARHETHWASNNQWPPPKRLIELRASISVDQILPVMQQGTAILWQGDFHQGRQILLAIKRRLTSQLSKVVSSAMPEGFHQMRLARSQHARTLGAFLIQIDAGWMLANPRSPDIRAACEMAYGHQMADRLPFLTPLSDLMGTLSAYQWHVKGVHVPALDTHIHPRHGVFAPTRQEYLDLLASADLPNPCNHAIDVGTGTGVIAAILARKGVPQVLAIDNHDPALQCAQDNVRRLGLGAQIVVRKGDLLEGAPRADLVVCNPPWLPGVARTSLEAAIHDPESRMLKGFLRQAPEHLTASGQAWLILSDLAEHLGLRTREMLEQWIREAGLKVLSREDIRPTHPKATDQSDPIAPWRLKEVTSLWRLSLDGKV